MRSLTENSNGIAAISPDNARCAASYYGASGRGRDKHCWGTEIDAMKWRIGDVTVTKVVELEVTGGSRFILPQATYEEILPIAWLRPHFADERGRLKMSIHALVVETPDRRIIVDTCLGHYKQGRRIPGWNNLETSFIGDLAEEGYARIGIDTVLC